MCFLNDAMKWNLNKSDIRTATVNSNDSYENCVSENFFATSIAVSYFHVDTRFITSADGLNKKTLDSNVYHTQL